MHGAEFFWEVLPFKRSLLKFFLDIFVQCSFLFFFFFNLQKAGSVCVCVKIKKVGTKPTAVGDGGQSFFELKNAFKIGRTFSNVRWKVWLNADVLAYFSFFWSYNFFSNFNLKLKSFVFFEILNILKITVFCSKSIFSICMSFCSNLMLVSLFQIFQLIRSIFV